MERSGIRVLELLPSRIPLCFIRATLAGVLQVIQSFPPVVGKNFDPRHVLAGPFNHRIERGHQVAPFFGQFVLIANWLVVVCLLAHHPCRFQAPEPVRKNIGRDALLGQGKLAVAGFAKDKIAHDQQRPFVAKQIQHIGHRAGGAVKLNSVRFKAYCQLSEIDLWRHPRCPSLGGGKGDCEGLPTTAGGASVLDQHDEPLELH